MSDFEAADRPVRAEMMFISCTTNVSFNLTNLRLHDNEMGHGRASVLPGGAARISALSVLRDSAVGGFGGRCSWSFVRIDESDPGVGSCF